MKLRVSKMIFASLLIVTLLSGCSLLDGVNHSLEYVDHATTYINDASAFADKVGTLTVQAATDPVMREELKGELESMKEKIINFNALDAPALAAEIHKELVSYNETLLNEINIYLDKINNQITAIEDLQIMKTIEKITNIQQQLEQLGL